MATLIKTDGSKLEIQPQNGLGFQLDELQKFVDGYIDIINLHRPLQTGNGTARAGTLPGRCAAAGQLDV